MSDRNIPKKLVLYPPIQLHKESNLVIWANLGDENEYLLQNHLMIDTSPMLNLEDEDTFLTYTIQSDYH